MPNQPYPKRMKEKGLVPICFIPDRKDNTLTLATKLIRIFQEDYTKIQIAYTPEIDLGEDIIFEEGDGHIIYGKPSPEQAKTKHFVNLRAKDSQTGELCLYRF